MLDPRIWHDGARPRRPTKFNTLRNTVLNNRYFVANAIYK